MTNFQYFRHKCALYTREFFVTMISEIEGHYSISTLWGKEGTMKATFFDLANVVEDNLVYFAGAYANEELGGFTVVCSDSDLSSCLIEYGEDCDLPGVSGDWFNSLYIADRLVNQVRALPVDRDTLHKLLLALRLQHMRIATECIRKYAINNEHKFSEKDLEQWEFDILAQIRCEWRSLLYDCIINEEQQ